MSLPIYRDTDHVYTVARDGARYVLAMTPIGGGDRHTISTPDTDTLDGAIKCLRDYKRQYRLEKFRRGKHGKF